MKTKNQIRLLRTGGIFFALSLALHIGFYWILRWEQTLQVMNPTDKAILLTLNLAGILLLIFTAGTSLFQTRQLVQTTVGRSVLLFLLLFLFRIVEEFLFFGFRVPATVAAIPLCLIPAIRFSLAPLFKPENQCVCCCLR